MFKGISFLLKFCWRTNKIYIVGLLLVQILQSALALLNVVLPKYIIDELVNARRMQQLVIYVSILLLANLFGNMLAHYLRSRSVVERMVCLNEFQVYLSEIMTSADFEQLENPDYHDMREKAFKFLYGEGWGFATVLDRAVGIFGSIMTFAGIIVIISMLNPLMVLIFVCLVLLNGWVESQNKKRLIEWDLERTPLERRSSYYQDIMTNFSYGKEMRIDNLGPWLIDKYRKQLKILQTYYKKGSMKNFQTALFSCITMFVQQIATYIYLIWRLLLGAISIGDFTMFLGAIGMFSSTMSSVLSSIVDINRFGMYYDATEKFLSVPRNKYNGKKLPLPKAEIHTLEFRDVSFKYPGQQSFALKHVSIIVKSGERLAVVGENGAGKTTFIKLMIRMYDPTDGCILLDGVDIRDIDYIEYMKFFSVVFQDYKLFSFSIFDNVALADSEHADLDKVTKIINLCGLMDKIDNLENGINTSVFKNFDEKGTELSGGEAQKLVLARAIYKNSPFVILDEPTSALDPRAEYNLYHMFDDLVCGKAAVYISHRLSSTRFCNKIAVFAGGEIIEFGEHADLLAASGLYAELFNMQAQYYENETEEKTAVCMLEKE